MPKLSALDLFRKVPTDLTQATRRGGLLSIIVASVIGIVLFLEVWTYAAGETRSRIVLDSNREAKLDVNFRLSFLELPCRFASVEVWDYLGNSKLDASASIKKTVITGEMGQQKKEQFIEPDAPITEKVPHAAVDPNTPNGVIKVTTNEYGPLLKANEYTFVMFYVEWCIFCKAALPVWAKFAQEIAKTRPNVRIVQVDCMQEASLCKATKIPGYPTFMMFKGVNPLEEDYHGERTIAAFSSYATTVASTPPEEHPLKYQWHEGCLLEGTLQVNRVPGNFHIQAKSDAHNFDQKSTNTSHIVHHLSFGDKMSDNLMKRVPDDVRQNISPLDGKLFMNFEGHMSHEHYIKIVSTRYEVGTLIGHREILGYQLSTSNHQYAADPNVPEARFSYDLSPTAVVISQAGRRWYEFMTSLCAIIGGTFTTFSLMDGVIHSLQRRLKTPTTPSSKLT